MADEKHPRSEGWLLQENEQLRARLEEAEMTLDAIRSGEVDALVIAGPQGERVFSLTGAETVYRVIAETMNEAALTVDAQGSVLFCNRRFQELLRAERGVVGRRLEEFTARAQRRPLGDLLASARSAPVQRRLTLRASDGRSVPVLLSAGPIPMGTQAAAPSAPDVCIVATDLTEIESKDAMLRELRQHQEALEASEARLRQSEEMARFGTFEWNIQTNTNLWSPELEALYGLPACSFGGTYEAWRASVHPDDVTEAERQLNEAMKTGVYKAEWRAIWPDGTTHWLEARALILKDDSGKPLRMIGANYDITERKLAEQALALSHEKLTRVLDSIQDDFYVLDRDWNFVYASKRFTGRIGKEPGDFEGNNIWKMFPKHLGTPFEENLRASMEKREVRRFEISGKYTSAYYSMSSFPSSEGVTVIGTDITARKKAEEALAAAYRLMQDLIDNTTSIVFACDLEERFVLANAALVALLKTTHEQLIGKRRHEFMPQADADAHEANDQQVIAAGHAVEFEENNELHGRSITWLTTKFPLRDAEGRIYGVAGIVTDITKRKKVEEAIRESRETLQSFYDSASFLMGIVELDGTNVIPVSANQATMEFFRTTAEQLPRTAGKALDVPAHIERLWVKNYLKSQREGMPAPFVYEHPRDDGTRWLQVVVAHIANGPTGRPRFSFVAEDITEGKQAEEALRASEQRFRIMADGIPFPIWVTDAGGGIEFVNKTYGEFFGVDKETVLGPKWHPLVHPEDTSAYVGAFLEANRRHRPFHAEARVQRADGEWRWIESFGAMRFSSDGEFQGMVGISPDITERKASEQELAMVREHMAQQEKMASLGRLAGGVAHELRNPLGAVKAALYLIDMDKERYNATVREAIDIINSEVTRSENIISSLLSLTRPIRSARKAVNVNAVLNDVLMITETGTVEVISDLDDTIPFVQSDPSELGILFGNIVTNAIQAMEGGGRLSVSSSSPEAGWIAVSIKDTGTGIPAENLNKIFEPLFTTKDTGIGIGLPLAKSIVDSNGGTIDVESELGKGSTFTIRLPIDLGGNGRGNGHLNAKGAIPRIVARSSMADRPPTKRKRVSGTK